MIVRITQTGTNRMMHKLVRKNLMYELFAFALICAMNSQVSADPGISQDRLSRLDAVMSNYIEQEKLPGTVVYISQHGKPVYYKAFGWRDIEKHAVMKNDDIFRIASQTKAITTVETIPAPPEKLLRGPFR